MYCRNCGAKIEENTAVCLSCGVKAGDGNKYCPNCGAEPDPLAVICVKCGVSLEEQSNTKKAFEQIKSGTKTIVQEVKTEAKEVAQEVKTEAKEVTQEVKTEAKAEVKVVRTIKDAFKVGIKKYVVFSGRANKAEFWWIYLMCAAPNLIVGLGQVASIALFIPMLSAMVRRLHDTGKPGIYALMGLIPLAGPIILLIQLLKPSDVGENAFGPDPNVE